MRICCISDLHGHLPELPAHELLLVAGDICPTWDHTPEFQRAWLQHEFLPWLKDSPAPKVVIWGNHDLIGENFPEKIPVDLQRYVLCDAVDEVEGLSIWGSPWQRRFFDWAFNLDEPDLAAKYAIIPEVDVIVTHGPPFGAGDRGTNGDLLGSPSLTETIKRVKPKLVVTGHIHAAYGTYRLFDTLVVNAAHCDEAYRPINDPVLVTLNDGISVDF